MSEETAARLHALLTKARAKHKPEAPTPGPAPQPAPEGDAAPDPAPTPTTSASPATGEDPVVTELVRSFLVWEGGSAFADAAHASIRSAAVDLNELRVFLPEEIAAMFGPDDPRAQERAERLRACLNDIYAREHDVRLAHLSSEGGKRDIRTYLDTLEGMHPFVAARVALLRFGAHAFPIDARLRDCLAKAKVCTPDQPPAEVMGWVERHVRAGEALASYLALEAMNDAATPARGPSRAGAARKPQAPRAAKPARPRAPKKSSTEK